MCTAGFRHSDPNHTLLECDTVQQCSWIVKMKTVKIDNVYNLGGLGGGIGM